MERRGEFSTWSECSMNVQRKGSSPDSTVRRGCPCEGQEPRMSLQAQEAGKGAMTTEGSSSVPQQCVQGAVDSFRWRAGQGTSVKMGQVVASAHRGWGKPWPLTPHSSEHRSRCSSPGCRRDTPFLQEPNSPEVKTDSFSNLGAPSLRGMPPISFSALYLFFLEYILLTRVFT